jgi:hypothetical protein
MTHAGCHFCGLTGDGLSWVRLRDDIPIPREWVRLGLVGATTDTRVCATHLAILRAAGRRGRRHAKTGIRWWLVAELPGRPTGPARRSAPLTLQH